MRLPDEPGFPVLPPGQPTRDLLLAQALDACITAERRLPGSSQQIIARQPAWARGDLQRLIGLAGSLDAATSNAVMSNEFRVAARARLMRRIGAIEAPAPRSSRGVVRLSAVSAAPVRHAAPRRPLGWATRVSASLVAAVLAVAATLTASASALPGEPLYGLKEAREELAVRLAADDQQRALALLQQANARLDETTRLLQQGRTLEATATTLRYDQVVERATMSYVGTVDDTPASAPAALNMEAGLSQQQVQLQTLLQSAPEPARADLREALVAAERGRALVADPRPVERALGRSDPETASAAVPTMAAEDEPAPTALPVPTLPAVNAVNPEPVPTRRPTVVLPTPAPAVAAAEDGDDAATAPLVAQAGDVAGDAAAEANTAKPETQSSSRPARATRGSPTVQVHDNAQDTSSEANGHGVGDEHPQAVDQAVLGRTSTDQGGDQESRGAQAQPDRSGRGQDVTPPSVARPAQEPAQEPAAGSGSSDGRGQASSTSGRSTGGDDAGVAARAAPTVTAPERTTTASTSSTSAGNTHDGGGDARVSPTAQATATKPPSTSASGPAVHHSSDGDQKSTTTAPAPASRSGDGDHSSNDSGH